MKLVVLAASILSVAACSSSKSSAPSKYSSQSSASSVQQVSAEEILNSQFPPRLYDEVMGLRDLVDFPVGMEVQAGAEERSIFVVVDDQQPVLQRHFNQLVAGVQMKMPYLHPQENTYFWDYGDQLVDYAERNGFSVHGHTLIWYFQDSFTEVPYWMLDYQGDWEPMLNDHVATIVNHYKGRVASWDVINEAVGVVFDEVTGQPLIDADTNLPVYGYRNTPFFQKLGQGYIENAFRTAHEADSDAELYYNEKFLSHNDGMLDFTLSMLEELLAKGVPVHGVGFEMHTWLDWPEVSQIRQAFSRAAELGLKIRISEMDVRVYQTHTGRTRTTELTAAISLQQKDRYQAIVEAYIDAVPASQRGGITFWGLIDGESWTRSVFPDDWPLLFNDDYTVKPAFYGVLEGLQAQAGQP